MALQNIITSPSRMDARSAETHRLSTISNIENALENDTYPPEQEKRLKRLLRILNDSASDNPDRKLAVLQVTVIPVLVSMGLIEES